MPEKRRSEKKELKVISTNTKQDQISLQTLTFVPKNIYFRPSSHTTFSRTTLRQKDITIF
jgi:hypothetical protein